MKKLLILSFALSVSACGRWDRVVTHYTGSMTYKCSNSGVQYVQSDSGLAVHVDREGRPIPCDNK